MNSLEIARLQNENKILRIKIDELYKSWLFDSERYKDLKEKYEIIKRDTAGELDTWKTTKNSITNKNQFKIQKPRHSK